MDRDDELAIELAAEKRRAAEVDARELDARRAELPRTVCEDARERWRWWRALGRRVLRALVRR